MLGALSRNVNLEIRSGKSSANKSAQHWCCKQEQGDIGEGPVAEEPYVPVIMSVRFAIQISETYQ